MTVDGRGHGDLFASSPLGRRGEQPRVGRTALVRLSIDGMMGAVQYTTEHIRTVLCSTVQYSTQSPVHVQHVPGSAPTLGQQHTKCMGYTAANSSQLATTLLPSPTYTIFLPLISPKASFDQESERKHPRPRLAVCLSSLFAHSCVAKEGAFLTPFRKNSSMGNVKINQ